MDRKILLDGFHVSFDSRVLFMKEIFRYPKIREDVISRLLEGGELDKWKKTATAMVGGNCFLHVELMEEDLIALFEKLTKQGRGMKKLEEQSSHVQYLGGMLQNGKSEIKVDLDGVLLLAYGIVTVKGCRQELERIFTEPEKYYAKFETSKYKECNVGSCIPVEYLWNMRLIIGILLELRETREESLYQQVVQVIYGGYGALKKDVKKHSYLTGGMIKDINVNFKNTKEDTMQMCSQMLITFIIMEELGVEMMWDFSIGALLPFIDHYEEELEQGIQVNSVDEKVEMKQSEWKERFVDTYGTPLSVRNLLLEQSDDGNADAVTQIMALFDINPRKFQEYELTEEEHRLVAAQKEKWNSKIYWGSVIIAQLCKYIRELEKSFMNEVPQYRKAKHWMEEENRLSDLKQKNILIKDNEVLQRKIDKLEHSLVVHAQTEKYLQKQIDISESKLKESQEVISNLKSYIYYSSENNSEEYETEHEGKKAICWEEKQVLVIGGHPSWQNKLRTQYPKWQFLISEQKNQLSEAIKGKEYIICNVNMLSHACYYKLLSCKEEGQKILYVRHTNIVQGMKELEKQL